MFDTNVKWNEDLHLSVSAFYNGYALSYQPAARAILLNKYISLFGRMRRAFMSGKYYYFLVNNCKKTRVRQKNNWMLKRVADTLKLGFKDLNQVNIHCLAALLFLINFSGYLYSKFFYRNKVVYSFPPVFTPYKGFKENLSNDFKSAGLIVKGKSRYLLEVLKNDLIWIQ